MAEELETLRTHQFVRPGQILLAEQDSAVVRAIKDHLEHCLHNVVCVGSAAEAHREIAENPPELILVGEKLLDSSGFELCHDIKDNSATQNTPVLLLSGQRGQGAEVAAAECGANDVLYKPIDLRLLELRAGVLLKYGRVVTALQAARRDLEERVAARTEELSRANEKLKREIAGHQQAENQLHKAQKMEAIGQLAGGVAHDFSNLLTVINGRGELLLSRLEPSDSRRTDLELIIKTGRRAATLTRQLLAFSRQQVLEPKLVNLNTAIADVQRMLRSLIREDIKFTILPTPELHCVKVDTGQIEQVLMNLVVNARDAMPGGGEMLIRTANVRLDYAYNGALEQIEPGEYVVLSVVDTGCGIDAATQARIFEPFFTTKKNGEGTGLGLSTVYGIVKQSGGYIDLSTHVGAGTTFKIYLPRVQGAAGPAMLSQAVPAVTSGEAVLLVEDDEVVRDLTRDLLESYGYSVLLARDGVDALKVAQSHRGPIHLLVTDVVMPNMGGAELAERFRLQQPKAKILFMSAYAGHPFAADAPRPAGIHFVQKPFTPRGLAGKVREALSA